ncbi:MAG: transposase [Acidobacteriia bacterium]|nr:transposase [Terriglobia bacterium]
MVQAPDTLAADKNILLAHLTAQKVEHHLDLGTGVCHLAKSHIAQVVVEALKYFHARRYRLQAWCVMPNHVHILFQLFPQERLSGVLHSWKSFTAKKCGSILGLRGLSGRRNTTTTWCGMKAISAESLNIFSRIQLSPA